MAFIDPNILLKGGQFTPFSSFAEGRESRDVSRLRGLQAQQAQQGMEQQGLQAQQQAKLAPLQLESAQLGLDTARRNAAVDQGLVDLGERFRKKEITEDEYLQEYQGLVPGALPKFIQQKKTAAAALTKFQTEQDNKQLDRKIKQDRLTNDKQKMAFDQLKLQFELDKPFREEKINQSFLNRELSANLAAKRNPQVRMTREKIKDVTARGVKTPQVMRIVNDITSDISKYGTEQLPTEAKNRMKSNMRILQGILKSEKFINLGVLTGPDLEFLEDITGDPTGFFSLSSKNILTRLGELKTNTIQEYNTAMTQNGFNAFSEQEILNLIPATAGERPEAETKVFDIPAAPSSSGSTGSSSNSGGQIDLSGNLPEFRRN